MGAMVIGTVNQKGGQGKSQGVHFLSSVLAEEFDKKVLIIDFDPQGAQTSLLGFPENVLRENPQSDVSLIMGEQMNEITPISASDKIDAILSDDLLIEFNERFIRNKENLLKKLVNRFREQYDFILIDAPPNAGSMISAVMLASDRLFVPVKTNKLDERGTFKFFGDLIDIKDSYEKEPDKIIVAPNLYESIVKDHNVSLHSINTLHKEVLEENFKCDIVVTDPIPKRSVFGTAHSDEEHNNIITFIKQKARSNMELLDLLVDITKQVIS
jgi:chromosome partitioning protein